MTTIGEPSRFAIEYELDDEPAGEWLNGSIKLWVAGRAVGEAPETELRSLRDYLYMAEAVVSGRGRRRNARLFTAPADEAVRLLDAAMFTGDDPDLEALALEEQWGLLQLELSFPTAHIYAIESDDVIRILVGPSDNPTEVRLPADEVYGVFSNVRDQLEALRSRARGSSMSVWATGSRADFGIEVVAPETESGFFNAEVVVWVQDVPTTVNEALTGLATSLANILSQPRRAELDLPPDWSPARVAWRLLDLLGGERTDIEDEQLFAHLALPLLDSARERVFFISRASSTELLVLAEKKTSKVLASSELAPGRFAQIVRMFLDWIDSVLPSSGRPRGSYTIA